MSSVNLDGELLDPWGKQERLDRQKLQEEAKRQTKRLVRNRKRKKQREKIEKIKRLTPIQRLLSSKKQKSMQLFKIISKDNEKELNKWLNEMRQTEDDEGLDMILNWVNSKGETPLLVSVMRSATEMIKILLEKAGNLLDLNCTDNQEGRSALIWAVINGDEEIVRSLLYHSARTRSNKLSINLQGEKTLKISKLNTFSDSHGYSFIRL